MSRTCTICAHPEREAIHGALDRGASINATAKQFEVPASNLKRHVRDHRAQVAEPKPLEQRPASAPQPEEPERARAGGAADADPMAVFGGHTGQGGRPCEVCRHPRRLEIERAIYDTGGLLGAYKKIQGCPDRRCLRRHRENCMPRDLERHREEITAGLASSARERVETLYREASDLLGKARAAVEEVEEDADVEPRDKAAAMKAAAAMLAQAKGCAELLARLTGELRSDVSIAVLLASPDWKKIEAALEDALAPYPEAAKAAARALRGLETGPGQVIDMRALPEGA